MQPEPNDATVPTSGTAASTAAVELAARLGASAFVARVVEVLSPTPTLRRVVLEAPTIGGLAVEPGQDVMVTVAGGEHPVRRRYTVRSFAPAAQRIAVHAVAHPGGPGGRWAGSVATGDSVELIGPRGKVRLATGADWHLMVGDETFVPAAYTMLESLAPGTTALAVFEVGAAVDERPLQASVSMASGPVWVHRDPDAAADRRHHAGALASLRALELPSGIGHAYVGGEAHLVRSVRAHLAERGVPLERIHAKAYWRADAPNLAHGEPDPVDG